MDDGFFQAFNADLSNEFLWHEFNTSFKQGKGKLKDAAFKNPSMLGDHVSLKAEAADSKPTHEDRGARSDVGAHKKPHQHEKETSRPEGKGKLKDAAMKNPSVLGDPVSLKAPSADSEPTDQDRGAQSSSKTGHDPQKTTNSSVDVPREAPAPTMTSLSSAEPGHTQNTGSSDIPVLPKIDGKALFWSMLVGSGALLPRGCHADSECYLGWMLLAPRILTFILLSSALSLCPQINGQSWVRCRTP